MYEEISFPEYEYESIQNYLNKLGYCYTTRVYKEVGKYKAGNIQHLSDKMLNVPAFLPL